MSPSSPRSPWPTGSLTVMPRCLMGALGPVDRSASSAVASGFCRLRSRPKQRLFVRMAPPPRPLPRQLLYQPQRCHSISRPPYSIAVITSLASLPRSSLIIPIYAIITVRSLLPMGSIFQARVHSQVQHGICKLDVAEDGIGHGSL